MLIKNLSRFVFICLLASVVIACGKNIKKSDDDKKIYKDNSQTTKDKDMDIKTKLEDQAYLREAIIEKDLNLLGTAIERNEGVDFNFEVDGETPLTYAIKFSDTSVITTIIGSSTNINLKNSLGSAPIHLAVLLNSHFLVNEIIKKKPQMNILNKYGETPLDLAIKSKNVILIKGLLIHGGKSSLPLTAQRSLINNIKSEKLSHLFRKITYWNQETFDKKLKINEELMAGLSWFLEYLNINSKEFKSYIKNTNTIALILDIEDEYTRRKTLDFLISNKAALNGITPSEAPIFKAITNKDEMAIKALIEADADIYLINNQGSEPLVLATQNLDYDIVKTLYQNMLFKEIEDQEISQKNDLIRLKSCAIIPYETRLWYRVFKPTANKIFNLLNCDS